MRNLKKMIIVSLMIIIILSVFNSCKEEDKMTKWEYKVIEIKFKSNNAIAPFLSQYGKYGWELVQVMNDQYIYKRRLVEKKKK